MFSLEVVEFDFTYILRCMSRGKKKEQSYDYLVKLIIIGDSGVGKTNILMRFCEQDFKSNYVATIGVDFKIKTIQIEDKRFKLQIWDTAGQERFKNITQTYYKGAVGIILAYSVVDERSFENIEKWIAQVNDSTSSDVQKILIANKVDLASERKITTQQGQQLAKKYGLTLLQCSAKEGTNIQEIFYKLGRGIKANFDKENTESNGIGGTQIGNVRTPGCKKGCEC